jgi:circadian clock protein KaiB
MTIAEKKKGIQKNSKTEPLRKNATERFVYRMRLFVAGGEANSVIARKNINEICDAHLKGDFKLEIIDVFENFSEAIDENVLVTPALVIDKPKKVRIYGNLQDRKKVLSVLELL